MATLTVTGVINNVRSDLNETATTMLSDAELTIMINDGQKDITAKGLCYEVKTAWDAIAANKIIDLGNTVVRVNFVEYKTGSTFGDGGGEGLLNILPQTIGHLPITTGLPQYWFQWGRYLVIEPIPTAATYSLAVYSASYPAAVLVATSADIPAGSIPVEFHECIYTFTLAFAALKLKRWADAANAYNKYIVDIQRKRAEYISKHVDNRLAHYLPDNVTMEVPRGETV